MCVNYQGSGVFWLHSVYLDTDNSIIFLLSSSGKTDGIKSRMNSESEPGWNLYIISTVSTIQLYREMVLPNSCFVVW